MTEEQKTDLIREMAKELGSRGGKTTLSKYGPDHFKKLSEKAAEDRKAKKIELL